MGAARACKLLQLLEVRVTTAALAAAAAVGILADRFPAAQEIHRTPRLVRGAMVVMESPPAQTLEEEEGQVRPEVMEAPPAGVTAGQERLLLSQVPR